VFLKIGSFYTDSSEAQLFQKRPDIISDQKPFYHGIY